MLITRLLCIQGKFTTPDQFIAPPSKFSVKYSIQPKWSTLSWTDPFRKARHISHQSFLSFLHKVKHGAVARRDSYSQFPRSRLGTPGTMTSATQKLVYLCFINMHDFRALNHQGGIGTICWTLKAVEDTTCIITLRLSYFESQPVRI